MADPLRTMQEQAEAAFIPYGPAETGVEIVETFGHPEAEYAAIRKGAAVLHATQRGVVEVTGGDRLEVLHNFLTNQTRTLEAGTGCRAFLLTRQGRVRADTTVLESAERALLLLDVFQADPVASELEQYVFTEDAAFTDRSAAWVHLSLHGPQAPDLAGAVFGADAAARSAALDPCGHFQASADEHECTIHRHDETGAPGLHVLAPVAAADAVYRRLADALGGLAPQVTGGQKRPLTGRGIGWLAYNIARIEAGVPLFHVDFGPDSLPHETGLLGEAVSFTKGCYLGQEVVARMESLGHPKKVLRGLRFESDRLPVAGSEVLDESGEPCGAVTSSTIGPMLGGVAVAFAMIRWGRHRTGTKVQVPAEGSRAPATVQDLGFLA